MSSRFLGSGLTAFLLMMVADSPRDVDAGPLSCCDDSLAMARCTGSASCQACSNCSRCAHCRGGGSCGVCARPVPAQASPPASDPEPSVSEERVKETERPIQLPEADLSLLSESEWIVEVGRRATPLYGKPSEPLRGRLRDPNFTPQIAGPALLTAHIAGKELGPQLVAAPTTSAIVDLFEAARLRDVEKLRRILVDGKASFLPPGVRVRVVEFREVVLPDGKPRQYAAVRVVDREKHEEPFFAPRFMLGRLVETGSNATSAVDAQPKPSNNAEEAARLRKRNRKAEARLKIAQDLEKEKKPGVAKIYYTEIVQGFPGTEAAKTAAERLRVLSKAQKKD